MIFVTGGTGLLGSHLLYQLTQQKKPLVAIYRDSMKIDTVLELFLYYDPRGGQEMFDLIRWEFCDVLDVEKLLELMSDCSYVYHCAAIVSFQKMDFYKMMKINRQGTANIVNLCLELGIKKLCYVSSTAAIGGEGEAVVSENSKWKQSPTTSGYSITKYSAEKEVWRGVEEGLDAVIVNPCVIIGAGDWNESSLTMFKTVAKGLKFYTAGTNAFVDARDVAKTMVYLMESEVKNERFLCIGENTSFRRVFDRIADQLDKKKAFILVKPWLMGMSWRLVWLLSAIVGKKSAITRETAKSAFSHTKYDDSKLKNELRLNFHTIEEMVDNAIKGRLNRPI